MIHVCGLGFFFFSLKGLCADQRRYTAALGAEVTAGVRLSACTTNYDRVLNPNVCDHTHVCSSSVAVLFQCFFSALLWHDLRILHDCGLRCISLASKVKLSGKCLIFQNSIISPEENL